MSCMIVIGREYGRFPDLFSLRLDAHLDKTGTNCHKNAHDRCNGAHGIPVHTSIVNGARCMGASNRGDSRSGRWCGVGEGWPHSSAGRVRDVSRI